MCPRPIPVIAKGPVNALTQGASRGYHGLRPVVTPISRFDGRRFVVVSTHHVALPQRNGQAANPEQPSIVGILCRRFLHAHVANPKFGSGFEARAALARALWNRANVAGI